MIRANDPHKKYIVRFCQTDEIDQLQQFIHLYWKENHILSQHQELLKFQHYDKVNDRFNFVVAVNPFTNKFIAILGFIPTYQYDPDLCEDVEKNPPDKCIYNRDIWLAIWKKDKDHENEKGLGMDLYNYLVEQIKPTSIAAIGINDRVEKLYQKLGFKTGQLDHWYMLNDKKEKPNYVLSPGSSVEYTDDLLPLKEKAKRNHRDRPDKTMNYFINRFQNHLIYKYHFMVTYGHFVNDPYFDVDMLAIFCYRVIEVDGVTCIRIIDIYEKTHGLYIADPAMLQMLMKRHNADYIDCVSHHNCSKQFFTDMGFQLKDETKTIIPNYFEPFEFRNITLKYAFKYLHPDMINYGGYTIFKGDSDQDRPNIV